MIGATFCVGVIGMYHSGIGGGGFMLVRSANGSYEDIDFRETAPAAAFEDMYKDNAQASVVGGLAAAVPGELRGLDYLHKNYGRLPWKTVVLPAVKVARDGFTVSADLVHAMGNSSFLIEKPEWAVDFAPNGTMLKLGDTMTRKRYANTLEKIAIGGVDVFYKGPMARATIEMLTKEGGNMTLKDLNDYKVSLNTPSEIDYKGYKLTACSAPAGGIVALSALKIFEGFPNKDLKDFSMFFNSFNPFKTSVLIEDRPNNPSP
jgi:gamma-glutamyltranspeptidase / glutathione hydrolase